jgi:hypothetical protein
MSREPGICDPYVKVSDGVRGRCGVLSWTLKVQGHLWVSDHSPPHSLGLWAFMRPHAGLDSCSFD